MKLSIIIPIRNENEGILKTLRIIKEKINDIDYELIVVNDFSEDNSYELVKKEILNDDKIVVFNNTKKGLGGAITLGINN